MVGALMGNHIFNTVTVRYVFTGTDMSGPVTLTLQGTFTSATLISNTAVGSDAIRGKILAQNTAQVVVPALSGAATAGLNMLAAGESGISLTPVAGGVNFQGRSAGDGFEYPYGVWGAYQHNDFEDDFTATAFDADSDIVLVGADFSPWDNMIFGAALGYETTDADTTFNGGNVESDGLTIAPYMGIHLSDDLGVDFDVSADLSFGFSFLDVDQFRTDPATGARVTSNTDADRVFVSGNVNASNWFGEWYIGGRFGLLYAKEDEDGFTESDGTVVFDRASELGRMTVGANVAYSWDSFEPFASVDWQYDYQHEDLVTATAPQPANDVNDFLLGFGVRWFGASGISASFEYNTVVGRDDFDSDTFTVFVRADF